MTSESAIGHGAVAGPKAMPATKSSAGAMTPSSPQRARRATLNAVTVVARMSTNAGTSSAW